MRRLVSILIIVIISLSFAQDAGAHGWGRYCRPRYYCAPAPYARPYYAPPLYRDRWVQPHWRRGYWGDEWVPGHWVRQRVA